MKKTFRYRLYPSNSQTTILNQTLNGCRWLYNYLLEQRKKSWESEKKSLSRYDQQKTFSELKKDQPFLKDIHSQVLQNISMRIDLAFRSFFRRVKSGDKPGYPRFRSKFRYDSFCYPQSGFKLLKNVVQLSKIGGVKINLHRPIEGTIKTCTIRRTPTGKWYVTFACDIEHKPIEQPIEPAIGLDMGLEFFATLSNSEQIANPRFFRKEEKSLAKVQRKLSAQEKATKARAKARKIVARVHERIGWKRENFAHQESRKLVNRFNTIVVEDLSINDMQKNNFRCINKSIGDVAWRMFLNLIEYKAEYAGKRAIKINPAYTSQNCSRCGNRQKLKLSDRVYHCPCCALSLNRDLNAAKNIISLGLQAMGVSQEAQAL
ncbi:MAG: transposase [Candidatus Curtissbacteria bacterium]|nr:transposase [Candidatus Curtissbacteria bacterium]MDZ4209633.1 transposase [Candidatus Curtissbacteria bacterium]